MILAASVLSACGGDGSSTTACVTELTISRADGVTLTVSTDAVADQVGERGTHFYLGIADYRFESEESVMTDPPDDGQHAVLVALRSGEDHLLRAGDVLRVDGGSNAYELPSFDLIVQARDAFASEIRDTESGTVTISRLASDRMCVVIDYRNSKVSVKGAVLARVRELH